MADYIRRDIVLKIINTVNDTGGFAGYADYCTLFDEIDTMPAADVQPVKRGKWIHDRRTQWKCSKCGNFLDFDGLNCGRGTAFYCPNFGADMRGDTE